MDVRHAALHKALYVEKLGTIRRNLFDGNEGILGIKMKCSPYGLYCEAKGVSFIIPYASIESMVVDTTAPESKPAKEKK